MLTLAVGASGSGKSAFAERLAAASPAPRVYLATMQVWDAESRARVQRHRAMRAGKGFATVEAPLHLAALTLPPCRTVLLEDLGNLAANERYDPAGAGDAALYAVLDGVEHIARQCGHLIVVSNEIFVGGSRYAGDTAAYLRLLADLNRALAARADNVYEVCRGIAVCYKGQELKAWRSGEKKE